MVAPLRMSPVDRAPRTAARVFVWLVIASGLLVVVGAGAPFRDPRLWFWIVACGVGEMLWLRLPVGRATMSMGSTANFAALLVLPLHLAIPAATLASLVVEPAVMRKPLLRALFNAAGTALAVAASGLALRALAPAGPFALRDARLFLAVTASAVVYYACNRALVAAVLALDGALPLPQVWQRNFGWRRDALPSGAALSLGVLLAYLHQEVGVVAVAFVLLPALVVFEAHRRVHALANQRSASAAPEAAPAPRAVNE